MSKPVHRADGTACAVASTRRRHAGAPVAVGTLAGLIGACAATPPAPPAPAAAAAPPPAERPVVAYPATRRVDQVDVYHGVRIEDPYRWLEDLGSPEVHAWVEAQNRVAQPYLESIPARAAIRARLTELWNYERWGASLKGTGSYSVPERHGGKYFYLHATGREDQSVLVVADALDAPPRTLLDPNAMSDDGTVALADFAVAPDGRHVAYATSDGGTDWKTWRIREVATGRDLDEALGLTKFTAVSWTPDGRGFYYSRYPAGPDGTGDDAKQVSLWYHALGTPQASDRFVYAIDDHATRNPYGTVTDDGRFLAIAVSDGYEVNGLYYLDLAKRDAEVVRLLDRWDARHEFLGNRGRTFFVLTTRGAPRGRIVAIDLDRPEPARWRTLVAESEDAIAAAYHRGGRLVVRSVRDARSVVRVHDEDGRALHELELPGLGQVLGFEGRGDDPETFYAYTDFATPWTIYRHDFALNRTELFRRPEVAFDPSRYVTGQVFYASKDGTRVPMFLVHRRDVPRDGRQPTLLYGYGGFNVPLLPAFSVPVATWLEMGGVYAVANLRGGGEYGEAWHRAGTKLARQNVFDDFVAAAEWLIANGWTSPDRLAILGRSNGGLLVGATMLQRPELYAAALPAVGVLDMLRYHTASANARQWSSDYGLAEDAAEFAALRAYSPLHNVEPGACYPPTLVTTAEKDDRVVPWHSYKFAATLQAAQGSAPGCASPQLLRVETRAGHGAGKPTWMQIDDYADQWAFLAKHLGMDAFVGAAAATGGTAPSPGGAR